MVRYPPLRTERDIEQLIEWHPSGQTQDLRGTEEAGALMSRRKRTFLAISSLGPIRKVPRASQNQVRGVQRPARMNMLVIRRNVLGIDADATF